MRTSTQPRPALASEGESPDLSIIDIAAIVGNPSACRFQVELAAHAACGLKIGTNEATVELQDDAGTIPLGVERLVRIRVDGPATLAGFGSAAPATEESFLDDVHTTFDGRAIAVIRPTAPCAITVTASAPGCDETSIEVKAHADAAADPRSA